MCSQKQNINALALAAKRSEEALSDLYHALLPGWRRRWREDVRKTLGDYGEIESLYNMTLYQTLQSWDPSEGDFEHMFNHRIKLRKIDLFRVNSRRYNRRERERVYSDDGDEGISRISEVADSIDVEEIVFKKKEADQRQLIDFLLDRANDPVTTRIVTKCYELGLGRMSITALAKALGLHHEVVKRKLRALSRQYDANRLGDYHEYLAV